MKSLLRKNELPDGWTFHVSIGEKCPHCHEPLHEPDYTVTSPTGRRWPLIGHKSEKKAREGAAIVANAHPLA